MGGTHPIECSSVAKDIRQFCIERENWIPAVHISGKNNIQAGRESSQTIHYLKLDDMINSETLIMFILRKPLKQSKPGVKLMLVKFIDFISF